MCLLPDCGARVVPRMRSSGRFSKAVSYRSCRSRWSWSTKRCLKRAGLLPHLTTADIDVFMDLWCKRGEEQRIYFDWRPALRDPDDDMLLELAVAGGVAFLITSNIRDFAAAKNFAFAVVTPGEFLSWFRTR